MHTQRVQAGSPGRIWFGDEFQRRARVVMTDMVSSINHGWWISDTIPLTCGIRQVCPFSPSAFIRSSGIASDDYSK